MFIRNTDEDAATGERSLLISAKHEIMDKQHIYIYKKTYYEPKDFVDSRYDPSFSPSVYPGESISVSVKIPISSNDRFAAAMFVHDLHSDKIYHSDITVLDNGQWKKLTYKIPRCNGALLDKMGVVLEKAVTAVCVEKDTLFAAPMKVCYIDDLCCFGTPDYTLCLSNENVELWNTFHKEISQFTRFKGLTYLECGSLHLSCADYGECYTGKDTWTDYSASFGVTPIKGQYHMVNFRVQGAEKSYAAGLLPDGTFALLKKKHEYTILKRTEFEWKIGKKYTITCSVEKNDITVSVEDAVLNFTDEKDTYYRNGAVGLSVMEGSHLSCEEISIGKC